MPIFFEGQNSRLWQIASHVHVTLRMALLINEFGKRVDTPVKVHVGDPITRDAIGDKVKDAKSLMAFLRRKTYDLSPKPFAPGAVGFEF